MKSCLLVSTAGVGLGWEEHRVIIRVIAGNRKLSQQHLLPHGILLRVTYCRPQNRADSDV
jgi:hypothetical protein